MLDVEEAQFKILESVSTLTQTQRLSIEDSLHRVLAEDIISSINVPPADNSAMDGYALCVDGNESAPLTLPISQRIPAGIAPKTLAPNSAARIFTGAEVPEGANAVVMQENCEAGEEEVTILKVPVEGQNIRERGQDIRDGETVLKKGSVIQAQHMGLLASIGIKHIQVHKPLSVIVLSTGDELVEPGEEIQPGQIYNSNQYMLLGLLQKLGCQVETRAVVEDTYDATQAALSECSNKADLIISTGGVSVGEEDHVKSAVEALGELNMWKVKIKPGKPLAFGSVADTPFLGLPGNPVSAFVTFMLFGTPLIKKMQGEKLQHPLSFFLPVNFDVTKKQTRPEYLRVRIKNQRVEKYSNQSSGVLSSTCWANALAVIPAQTTLRRGELIQVFPFALMLN